MFRITKLFIVVQSSLVHLLRSVRDAGKSRMQKEGILT